nr:MAG TPA: hypothetical protein [Caudoviricetes sp.]
MICIGDCNIFSISLSCLGVSLLQFAQVFHFVTL